MKSEHKLSLALFVLLGLVAPGSTFAQAKQVATSQAPFSLTGSDGTGLALVDLDAKAIVDGPLAFTELKLVFENPHNRAIEGRFKVVMPDGAAISRFAMKIRGNWMEGEVVEKQAARRAYEDALHRRVDPALLEQDAGNVFRARIFPIAPREKKELIISWSNTLTDADEAYRLPLKGLPRIHRLNLVAMTRNQKTTQATSSLGGTTGRYRVSTVTRTEFTPDRDWVIYGEKASSEGEALINGNLAAVRFTVPSLAQPVDHAHAVVLFDTSASRGIGFDARVDALKNLVSGLATIGVEHVNVVAYDQTVAPIFVGPPNKFGEKHQRALKERGAMGASDLGLALSALTWTGMLDRRVIIMGDGVVTAGVSDPAIIDDHLAELGELGIVRVDAIVDTTARDQASLDRLVSTLPNRGVVIEGRAPLTEQLARLSQATLKDIKVAVPGAAWVWPQKLVGLQPNDVAVVFADVSDASQLRVELSGGANDTITPTARSAERPLLERAWVEARIKRLEAMRATSDPDLKAAMKQQVISLSTRHRVLSPYTALVVLETEHDYRRFNIQRNALADILTVGAVGLEVKSRKNAVAQQRPETLRKQAAAATRRTARERPKVGKSDSRLQDIFGTEDDFASKLNTAMTGAGSGMAVGSAELEEDAEVEENGSGGMGLRGTGSGGGGHGHALGMGRIDAAPAPRAERSALGGTRRRSRSASRIRQAAREPGSGSTGGAAAAFQAKAKGKAAVTGEMARIDGLIDRGRVKNALLAARAWLAKEPTNLLSFVALGKALSASGQRDKAARAFGSILDLFPSRADMRRLAGNWLEWIGEAGLMLAVDTYQVAMEQRGDHPAVYHQLAMVLLRLERYEEAFNVVKTGRGAHRINSRFPGIERILNDDLVFIAQVWSAAQPTLANTVKTMLAEVGLNMDTQLDLRFILTWETDANDVDFHIYDKKKGHASYQNRQLKSGGQLYADVTSGYGPESFVIPRANAYPYTLQAHYYSRGPMGYGAGKVQIIRHDGKGRIGFDERPFVIMQDGAFVNLGTVSKSTAQVAL